MYIESIAEEKITIFVQGVESIAVEEHLVIYKVDQERHFVQIFSFSFRFGSKTR